MKTLSAINTAKTAVKKGIAHAVLIPLLIGLTSNYFFEGNFGFMLGIIYLGLASLLYYFSEGKDVTKLVFFTALKAQTVLFVAYLSLTSIGIFGLLIVVLAVGVLFGELLFD